MKTRPLGSTGMNITRVGLGAWAMGGGDWAFAWGPQDDRESIAAIRRAIELGVNWIDTAAVYGLGHSEEVVAEALQGVSPKPYVFTKCGLVWDENHRKVPAKRIGDPKSIRKEVEASLRRLRVDRIDLYQMHWPAEDGSDYWPTLLDLKKEGKVAHVGLSNHDVRQLEAAEKRGHVETLQPPFSAIRRDAAAELAWCDRNKTGVIVYSPMQAGLLSGTYRADRTLPADDWRTRSPEFSGERLQRNLALADSMRPVADRYSTSVGAVAVAWTLAWRGVTGAIVGARNARQVDGWIRAGTLELTAEDLSEIERGIERTGAGSGPRR